jgi:hypothetical protein
MAAKVNALHLDYTNSLAEMKGLLSTQKKVGNQWKDEMELLTKRFQGKVREMQAENREMNSELDGMKGKFREKDQELEESRNAMRDRQGNFKFVNL